MQKPPSPGNSIVVTLLGFVTTNAGSRAPTKPGWKPWRNCETKQYAFLVAEPAVGLTPAVMIRAENGEDRRGRVIRLQFRN